MLERDNNPAESELKESSPPVEEGVGEVVSNATGKDLDLVQDNIQSEPEVKESSPSEEKVSLAEATEAASEAMEVERAASEPKLEPEPVKPFHISAKREGEVAEDPENLLEETAEELEDQMIITSIRKDDLSLLDDLQGPQEQV